MLLIEAHKANTNQTLQPRPPTKTQTPPVHDPVLSKILEKARPILSRPLAEDEKV